MVEFFLHINEQGISNPVVWSKRLQEFMQEPGMYKFSVLKGKKRSHVQNAFYWCVVCPIVLECLRNAGYNEVKEPEDAHEILKYRFLKKQIPNKDGEYVEMIGSTKKLTTKEFNQYLEDIAQWVSESFSVVVPQPNEQSKLIYGT